MPVAPLVMEAANLFAGQGGGTTNPNHLRLMSVKLPGWEEQTIDFHPGGAPVAIEVDVGFAKLQCDFVLAGWTPQVDQLLEAWSTNANNFWVFGALRDRMTGGITKAIAELSGRLGKAQPQEWGRGNLSSWAYSIRSLYRYRLTVGNVIIYDWQFFNNTLQIGGEPAGATPLPSGQG